MPFKKAVKRNSKLRMAIAGIAGSGKTRTSLILATVLANGQPIALIDTEHGSASKYADDFQFDVLELSNFDPRNYIKAIHEAEQAGYAVLIIDSLTHAWNGTGGALELVESIAKKVAAQRRKDTINTFNAWSDVTPLQNKLIDTILVSPLHIIATMRSKTEYIVETVDGKSTPRKVGMAPIQRADVEYEFDISADMDASNTMIIQKTRCPALNSQIIPKPDAGLAGIIQKWLAGEPEEPAQTPRAVSTVTALSLAEVASQPQEKTGSPVPKLIPEQPLSLNEQIKQVKLRASSLGLAKDSAEWAGLLKACKVTTIKSVADLAKVTEYMDQFERERAESPTHEASSEDLPLSEQQISTIKKLCGHLSREMSADLSTMTFQAAGSLIQELSNAYREQRQAIPVR